MTPYSRVLIIGAGSGIAQAVMAQLLQTDITDIIAVQRDIPSHEHTGVRFHRCDYSPSGIAEVMNTLKASGWVPDRVFICNGVLHGTGFGPEKQIASLEATAWAEVMQANALVPVLWLQALMTLLPRSHSAKIVIFSARVGSIADNRLGGWYSYRASKAALNMMVRSAAIECFRTHRRVGLMLFHPGTTDTPLSKPFQANVPDGKLFSPDFVAERLLTLIEQYATPGDLQFRDWAGEPIPW
ncbi:SDR family NAD(P)-dependent oxidoreductase [Reinekea blandensis]|uniref:Oxidoreductase, short-chain dehydrogenase/reductase family protein n=1 Tax=Reinekea blandensis MED297 TaxID=314283 RepID=A4BDD3_9GAMM|nr:SDR family NAD(P)-dependent oxidoreductase [Reinekea blandensis]EAR09877.1 oxidoreductase, short-chain dehydrogenase/reductase family protein [Reinekea sp. MED297] [Reinekea blandensis MED297]